MSSLHESIPWELAYAIRVLLNEHVDDDFYRVREDEGKGWEGPRVVAFGDACQVITRYAAPPEATKLPPSPEDREIAELEEKLATIEARIKELKGMET